MAHKMGLAQITLASKTNVPTTIAYLNNVEQNRTGSNTISASSSFLSFSPYNNSGTYMYIIRYDTNILLNSDTGTDQWRTALTYNIKSGSTVAQTAYSRRHEWPAINTATWSYSSGASYTFKIPCNAKYFIQCWGAAGGTNVNYYGLGISGNPAEDYGRGAYAAGNINLKTTTNNGELYVYVGDVGTSLTARTSTTYAGGFNGGGYGINDTDGSDSAAGGGGATDIRTTNNATSWISRIIVAGGGGGGNLTNSSYTNNTAGMHGGAPNINALISGWTNSWTATVDQTRGYAVGQGQNGRSFVHGGGGGGGGYMGGYSGDPSATSSNWQTNGKGSGGSSFISGATGCATIVGYEFEDTQFISGTSSSCPSITIGGSPAALGKVGGHARITFLSSNQN